MLDQLRRRRWWWRLAGTQCKSSITQTKVSTLLVFARYGTPHYIPEVEAQAAFYQFQVGQGNANNILGLSHLRLSQILSLKTTAKSPHLPKYQRHPQDHLAAQSQPLTAQLFSLCKPMLPGPLRPQEPRYHVPRSQCALLQVRPRLLRRPPQVQLRQPSTLFSQSQGCPTIL
jgi:hypothetical protein